MIFNRCFLCKSDTSEWLKVIWFVPFIMVFQFGWASVQISHLSLIPELSSVPSSRATMNSLRYAFTVIANLSVFFALFWLLSESTGHSSIGPWDFNHFRLAGWLVVILGVAVSILFYTFTKEPVNQRRLSRLNSFSSDASELVRMHWTSWFGHLQFYQIALLYMLSRLYINVSQVYFPFYITLTQNFSKEYVAILPMVSYISSFSVSMINSLPWFSKLSKKILYIVGVAAGLTACFAMLFELPGWKIYLLAVGIGIAQAILLITSLSITADLINKNTESGAFVYGAMSFFDKLSNGIAYQLIELWNPACDSLKPHQACVIFYRDLMVYVPGACLVLALLIILSLAPYKIGERRRRRRPVRDDEQAVLNDNDDDEFSNHNDV
uniref:Major facilitator superfamily domain-containing protein 12 n=1 Tax=Caenorhabditis japonica TaxID=281687 RepID=A0A8R1DMY3_CAEJA